MFAGRGRTEGEEMTTDPILISGMISLVIIGFVMMFYAISIETELRELNVKLARLIK
jgi:hypothetical protein